ncbi:MAG: response regulator transcription factor [Planctomycetes bacterium]|nr:response regulator transcription factor [Planctomycetota bacterium]
MTRILVIEDDPDLAFILADNLEADGYTVLSERDGERALARATSESFDLLLLDIMLPGVDGFTICREVRRRDAAVPILIISARTEERDKVRGLDLGADDYVAKPFGRSELLARVRALLRRAPTSPLEPIRLGDAVIDLAGLTVVRAGTSETLTHHEAEVLRILVRHRGRVVDRETLLREVWDVPAKPRDRLVDHHIVKLRRKIEVDPKRPRYLLTAYGEGYRLVD